MIKIRRIETCCLREFIINVHTSRRTIARVERPQSAVSSRFSWRRNRRIGRWRTFFLIFLVIVFSGKISRERKVSHAAEDSTHTGEREKEYRQKSVDGSIPRERERENREKLEEEEEEGKEREKKSAHLNCRVCVLKQWFNMKSSACELFSQSRKNKTRVRNGSRLVTVEILLFFLRLSSSSRDVSSFRRRSRRFFTAKIY